MPKYFTRLSGTGAFAASGSWASATTLASALTIGSNCAPPTSNDEAYILVGKCNISNSLNTSGFTGALTIGPGFAGTIGTAAGSALDFPSGVLKVQHSGTGAFVNFKGTVSRYDILGTGPAYIKTSTFLSGSTVYVGPGANVEFDTGAKPEKVYNAGGFVSCGTSGAVDVTNHDGTFESQGPITGTLDVRGGDAVVYNTATVSNVYVGNGARYNHASVGTISFVEVYPNGTAVDRGAPGPFTVTGGNIWPNASLFQNPQVTITYTNPIGRRGMP